MCAPAHVHTRTHRGMHFQASGSEWDGNDRRQAWAQRTACGPGPPSQRHDQLWIDSWASLLLKYPFDTHHTTDEFSLNLLLVFLSSSSSLPQPLPPRVIPPPGLEDSLPSYSPVLLQPHPWHPGQRGAQRNPPDNSGHRGNAFFLYRCPMELCSSSRNIENNPHDQQCKHLKIHYASACLGLGGRRAGRGSRRLWVSHCTDENVLQS